MHVRDNLWTTAVAVAAAALGSLTSGALVVPRCTSAVWLALAAYAVAAGLAPLTGFRVEASRPRGTGPG